MKVGHHNNYCSIHEKNITRTGKQLFFESLSDPFISAPDTIHQRLASDLLTFRSKIGKLIRDLITINKTAINYLRVTRDCVVLFSYYYKVDYITFHPPNQKKRGEMKASLIIFIGCCLLGLFLCYVEAASVNDRVATNKDFRSRRGFKNAGLSTARGFGKRSSLDNQVDDDES